MDSPCISFASLRFIYDCSFGFSVHFATFRLSMVVFYTDPFHRLLWVRVFIRSARNDSCVSCVWWIVVFDAGQETIHESTRNITNCNLDTKRAGSTEIFTADAQRTDSLSNRAIGS